MYQGEGQLGTGNTNQIGANENEMGDYLSLIDLGEGYTITDIAISCCSDHSCVLLENGTDFIGLKCWGGNSIGELGLNDTENRGDDENEMGDYLPFVSISITTPTAAPITNLTADPTALPTMKPTAVSTVHPTVGPTQNPTTNPTSERTVNPNEPPTVFPTFLATAAATTFAPSAEPTSSTTESPTAVPTTTCNAQQNCTECMQMNSGDTTQCLWHSTNVECVTLDELEYIDENVIFEDTLCSENEKSVESIFSDSATIVIIAVGSLLVISCCLLIFVILRKRKKRINEVAMVNIDMYPNLSREPELRNSPKNDKQNVIPDLNSNPRSEGRQAEVPGNIVVDERIVEMFTTTEVTTRGFAIGVQSIHNDHVTMDIDGARLFIHHLLCQIPSGRMIGYALDQHVHFIKMIVHVNNGTLCFADICKCCTIANVLCVECVCIFSIYNFILFHWFRINMLS